MNPIYDQNDLFEYLRWNGRELDGKWMLVILANPHHRCPALDEIYSNFIYLDHRTEDVVFFLPGYANMMHEVFTWYYGDKPWVTGRKGEKLIFDQRAFANTVAWLESKGYRYSEQAELLFLRYRHGLFASVSGFDLGHIESFNLDKLVRADMNLTAFFRQCNGVVRGEMTIEDLKAQYSLGCRSSYGYSVPSRSAKIFISYRREGGRDIARTIEQALKAHGFRRIFFDYNSLQDGVFNEQILTAIDECTDYLLVLSPGALDRCANEGDWVAMELRRARSAPCRIIPVTVNSDNFPWPSNLPSDLRFLQDIQFLKLMTDEYFNASIDRLVARLNSTPL